jgi:2,3-bisphosphoglycerate-independent phosphoglycerate mutase
LKSGEYGFILVNFANPDMVGHTGIVSAAIKAVEAVDCCLGKILTSVKETGAIMLLTADHGNAECMVDSVTKEPFTAHTTNVVPFAVINNGNDIKLKKDKALCDIAPTVLKLLDIPQPAEMTGESIID